MINLKQVKLEKVEPEMRPRYLKFLYLADDSEAEVNKYINDGEMFSIQVKNEIAGVLVCVFHSKQVVELKNIALDSEYRGIGLGKLVVSKVFTIYKKEGFHKMIVGTANSSIANLAFYQKVGFRMTDIKKDFFRNYPSPVFEDGIRAIDMVMFEKSLI